eukprot:tig00000204_g17731.t1
MAAALEQKQRGDAPPPAPSNRDAEYRCACRQCEEALSPAAQATRTARFCNSFLEHLETVRIPETQSEAYRVKWQGELYESVAKRGEHSLVTVAYALRLARLDLGNMCNLKLLHLDATTAADREIFAEDLDRHAVYVRFLAPWLLDAKRRDELLGAASAASLAQHVVFFGIWCSRFANRALAKQITLIALDIMKRLAKYDERHALVADALWNLAKMCVALGDRDEAWVYFQAAAGSDRDSGDEQRLAARCCRVDEAISKLSLQFYEAGLKRKAEEVLQLGLEAANSAQACTSCQKRNILGFALFWLGDMILQADLGMDRAEAYLKRALVETERNVGDCKVLTEILNALGDLCIQSERYHKASSYLRRAIVVQEVTCGLVDKQTENTFVMLNALLIKYPDPAVASFFSTKLLAFAKEAGRLPFGMKLDAAASSQTLDEILHEALTTGCSLLPGELNGTLAVKASLAELAAANPGAAAGSPAPSQATSRLSSKLEERRRALEGRKKAEAEREAERERARREAERAERAERDAADREAALEQMRRSKWAGARRLLNALLKRSPGDAEARLLRIQCTAGAGDLEAAAREAEAWERELAASDAAADLLARVRQERQGAETAIRERREAEARAAEEARRRAEEERRELEQRRLQELEERQQQEERRRLEEARRRQEQERQRQQQAQAHATAATRSTERSGELQVAPHRPSSGPSECAVARGPSAPLAMAPAVPARALEEEDFSCAVCLDSEPRAGPTVALPCGHRFHSLCIATWGATALAAGTGCPHCRAPLPASSSPSNSAPNAPPGHGPAPPSGASPASALAPPAPPSAGLEQAPVPPARPAAAHDRGHPPPAAPAPVPAASAPAPRPTRPYLPPGGPIARPTRPYDPFNRGPSAGPSGPSPL